MNQYRSHSKYQQQPSSNSTRIISDSSEKIFSIVRQIICQTLQKSDRQIQQLAFMNLKIAQVILKCNSLCKLQSPNCLKAVLFETLILVKQQCLTDSKPDNTELIELKLKYNTVRANNSELRDALSEAKQLVEEGGLLIGGVSEEGRGKKGTVVLDDLKRRFEGIRGRIARLGVDTNDKPTGDYRDGLLDRLNTQLQHSSQQIAMLEGELEQCRVKWHSQRRELQQQNQQVKQEVIMLRTRLSQLRQQGEQNRNIVEFKPGEAEQDLMALLLMQSLSLQQLLPP